jgi:hypothetical protein
VTKLDPGTEPIMIRTSLALLAVLVAAPLGRADDPPVGTTLTLPVVSVSISVGGTDRDAKRAVYAPPPGWYVRSHRIVASRQRGSVSYAVNTVPAGWAWRAEEQAAAGARSSAAATLIAYQVSAGGQAAAARSTVASELQANASSHHLLVVDVAARGPGLWWGESGVELTVVADLVYLGR